MGWHGWLGMGATPPPVVCECEWTPTVNHRSTNSQSRHDHVGASQWMKSKKAVTLSRTYVISDGRCSSDGRWPPTPLFNKPSTAITDVTHRHTHVTRMLAYRKKRYTYTSTRAVLLSSCRSPTSNLVGHWHGHPNAVQHRPDKGSPSTCLV
mmetsp:Transcript_18845/g.45378  ORF Transcript_18845/g.45378 Transcript_18845/m.45378 type:complete len:151 (-) Transcript_18845:258-710(-)